VLAIKNIFENNVKLNFIDKRNNDFQEDITSKELQELLGEYFDF
jgi:hypothetical protein